MKHEYKCCQCLKVLVASDIFSFGGGFACENCVREYYSQRDYDKVINDELRERHFMAVNIIGRKRFSELEQA